MLTTFILLVIGGYLLGSIPASLLAARARGHDLRKLGTFQVGAGNLWRTTSRRLAVIVGIYDFFKGIVMVTVAFRLGLEPAQQLAIGLAVVIGHNWPVFLRFHGGRGIATAAGLILFMPIIDPLTYWGAVAFLVVLIGGVVLFRSTPVAVLIGVALQPVFMAAFTEDIAVTLAYIALLLVIIIKRLTAQKNTDIRTTGIGRVLLNRLLYDRDIADRKAWVNRNTKKRMV